MDDSKPNPETGQASRERHSSGMGATRPRWLDRVEPVLVFLICLHSLIVGLILLLAPGFSVRLAGWQDVRPLFFPRQAGIFHIVLAAGYATEYLRRRGISLILIAKSTAFCFLVVMSLAAPTPWAVPFCGVFDGLMAVAVLLLRKWIQANPAVAASTQRGDRAPRRPGGGALAGGA
ncbi:MAG: hypothetical protein FJY88_05095 [Candidatus Eisenbacteria bacterium]|nr:hypothetical protein [Candidatus Eisenbacteria bacterium]